MKHFHLQKVDGNFLSTGRWKIFINFDRWIKSSAPGPNCPGPNCPGPNCPGPNLPGPNLPRTTNEISPKSMILVWGIGVLVEYWILSSKSMIFGWGIGVLVGYCGIVIKVNDVMEERRCSSDPCQHLLQLPTSIYGLFSCLLGSRNTIDLISYTKHHHHH